MERNNHNIKPNEQATDKIIEPIVEGPQDESFFIDQELPRLTIPIEFIMKRMLEVE